jgi:hypothetical protein
MILGYFLYMMGSIFGGIIAFGIVVGCLFKGLFFLDDVRKKISVLVPEAEEIAAKYDTVNYLRDRDVNYLKQKGDRSYTEFVLYSFAVNLL